MIYAGFAFGTMEGTILNLVGLFGAAWLGYEAGIGGRFGVEKLKKRPVMQKYESWLENYSLKTLTILRILPLTLNDIMSISCGFLKFKRIPYLVITLITAIPYALLWSYIGANNIQILLDLFPTVYNPYSWIVSFVIVVTIGTFLVINGSKDDNIDKDSNN